MWKLYLDANRPGGLVNSIKYIENHAKEHNTALLFWLTVMDNAQAQVLYDKVATRTSFVKYLV
jgi:hypothetical protein